ncbi:MAG: hypothetical protein WBD02_05335 [Acidimicrobiia bacterium]
MNESMNPMEQKLANFLMEEGDPAHHSLVDFDTLVSSAHRTRNRHRAMRSGVAGLAVAASIAGIVALQSDDGGRAVRVGVMNHGSSSKGSSDSNVAAAPSATAPKPVIAADGQYIAAVIDERVVILDRQGQIQKTLGSAPHGDHQQFYWTGERDAFVLLSTFDGCAGPSYDGAEFGTTLTKFNVAAGTSSTMFSIDQVPNDGVGYFPTEGLLPIYSGCDVRPTYVVDVLNSREAVCAESNLFKDLPASELQKEIADIRRWQGGRYPEDPKICDRLLAAGGSVKVPQSEGQTAGDGSTLENVISGDASSDKALPSHYEVVAPDGTRTRITKDRFRVGASFVPAGTDLGVLSGATASASAVPVSPASTKAVAAANHTIAGDHEFVLATLDGKLVILNRQGKIVRDYGGTDVQVVSSRTGDPRTAWIAKNGGGCGSEQQSLSRLNLLTGTETKIAAINKSYFIGSDAFSLDGKFVFLTEQCSDGTGFVVPTSQPDIPNADSMPDSVGVGPTRFTVDGLVSTSFSVGDASSSRFCTFEFPYEELPADTRGQQEVFRRHEDEVTADPSKCLADDAESATGKTEHIGIRRVSPFDADVQLHHLTIVHADGTETRISKDREQVQGEFIPAGADLGVLSN